MDCVPYGIVGVVVVGAPEPKGRDETMLMKQSAAMRAADFIWVE